MNKTIIIILAIMLASCGAVEETKTNQEITNQKMNEKNSNSAKIETNNPSETEAENETIRNETLIGEPAPETIMRNEVSENFIQYEFELSEQDNIRAAVNGEVIFDSRNSQEAQGELKGYKEKGNTLSIEFTDHPDNTTTSFKMLLNGEEEVLAWRQYNTSGTYEAPLDFVIEEGQG